MQDDLKAKRFRGHQSGHWAVCPGPSLEGYRVVRQPGDSGVRLKNDSIKNDRTNWHTSSIVIADTPITCVNAYHDQAGDLNSEDLTFRNVDVHGSVELRIE